VPATIQAQNQREDVCVRDYTPIPSENSTDSLVKIVKILGEGGFSFVYLAQDEVSGVSASPSSCGYLLQTLPLIQDALIQKEFALKKIRCPTGAEAVEEAMREVAAYRRFKCVSTPYFCPPLLTRASDTLTSSDYM
jgi:serine/threonine protein kinase